MKVDCFGCRYKSDSGCAYTGNGCAFDNTTTIEMPVTPQISVVKLVEISPESIDKIADAVIERMNLQEAYERGLHDAVKHGHWEYNENDDMFHCTNCKKRKCTQ